MQLQNKPRICRVIPTHPSDQTPGAGLPAYYLTANISYPTLHIIRRQTGDHRLRLLPDHARLVQIGYPDFAIGNTSGILRKILAAAKMFFALVFCVKSAPSMARFHPTIIHTHTAIPLFHGLFGKYVLKARWIVTIHGSDFLEVRRNRVLQRIMRRADAICYVSDNMGDEFKRLFPNIPCYHTPSGVSLELFCDPGKMRKHQVVMVGRLSWQKGYAYAIQGFHWFRDKHPGWQLVILGEGDQRQCIEQQIEELKLQSHVRMPGSCSQEIVAATLQESTIFLLSSITEGFPKVLLEAAACGTPVVATDVGDCREISDRAGMTVQPEDAQAIARGLSRLADDGEFWEACSKQGKQLVEKYQWSQVAHQVLQIYA